MGGRVRAQQIAAPVRRGVVDGDDLDRARRVGRYVRAHRVETLVQVRLHPVDGDDDAEQRGGRGLVTTPPPWCTGMDGHGT